MSLPMLARVVHLQLLMAFVEHRLCTLHLQTTQLKPCDVTPATVHDNKSLIELRLGIVKDGKERGEPRVVIQ